MSESRVRLALTVGDPGGIGPEITGSLLATRALSGADVYVVGAHAALSSWLPATACGAARVIPLAEAARLEAPDSFPVYIDTGEETAYRLGRPTAEGGRASGLAIETAAALAKRGLVEGIVTGPDFEGGSRARRLLEGEPYRASRESLRRARLPDDDGLGRPPHRDPHEGHPPAGTCPRR